MTDRAEEIAIRSQAIIVQDWDTKPELSVRRVAALIRAYGDERANAALEEAVEACREIENNDGDEHYEYCDCVTVVEDECNCYMSKFRKAVAALKVKT